MNGQPTISISLLASVLHLYATASIASAQVHSTGLNVFGHLGNGTTIDADAPTPISLENAFAIAAGGTHTLALTADGKVWAWGNDTPMARLAMVQAPSLTSTNFRPFN